MGKKRANQPGYEKKRDRNGNVFWCPVKEDNVSGVRQTFVKGQVDVSDKSEWRNMSVLSRVGTLTNPENLGRLMNDNVLSFNDWIFEKEYDGVKRSLFSLQLEWLFDDFDKHKSWLEANYDVLVKGDSHVVNNIIDKVYGNVWDDNDGLIDEPFLKDLFVDRYLGLSSDVLSDMCFERFDVEVKSERDAVEILAEADLLELKSSNKEEQGAQVAGVVAEYYGGLSEEFMWEEIWMEELDSYVPVDSTSRNLKNMNIFV